MNKPLYAIRIAELRNSRQLTQQQLADILKLTRGRLNNYEQGIREPDFSTLQTLADFFGVTVDYLLGRTDEPGQNRTKPDKAQSSVSPEDLELLEKLKNLPEKDRKVIETIIKLNELTDEQAAAGN